MANKQTFNIGMFLGHSKKIQIIPLNEEGQPTDVEAGSLVIVSTDESKLLITQDKDNPTFLELIDNGAAENDVVIIPFESDTDRSEGVRKLSGTLIVTFSKFGDDEAVKYDVLQGESTPLPEAAPTPGNQAPEETNTGQQGIPGTGEAGSIGNSAGPGNAEGEAGTATSPEPGAEAGDSELKKGE